MYHPKWLSYVSEWWLNHQPVVDLPSLHRCLADSPGSSGTPDVNTLQEAWTSRCSHVASGNSFDLRVILAMLPCFSNRFQPTKIAPKIHHIFHILYGPRTGSTPTASSLKPAVGIGPSGNWRSPSRRCSMPHGARPVGWRWERNRGTFSSENNHREAGDFWVMFIAVILTCNMSNMCSKRGYHGSFFTWSLAINRYMGRDHWPPLRRVFLWFTSCPVWLGPRWQAEISPWLSSD